MKKLLLFGLSAGTVWSLVPMYLSELDQEAGEILSVLVSGAMTGVFVTLLLWTALPAKKKWISILLGTLSLPLGAFLFGLTVSFIHLSIREIFGVSYRFIMYEFRPIEAGLNYAIMSLFSLFAIPLVPLAIGTTFGLSEFIKKNMSNQSAHTTSASAPL